VVLALDVTLIPVTDAAVVHRLYRDITTKIVVSEFRYFNPSPKTITEIIVEAGEVVGTLCVESSGLMSCDEKDLPSWAKTPVTKLCRRMNTTLQEDDPSPKRVRVVGPEVADGNGVLPHPLPLSSDSLSLLGMS
jgi:hypothetical protein